MKKQFIACFLVATTCLTSLNSSAFAKDEKASNFFGRGGAVTASSGKSLSSSISVDKEVKETKVNEIAASFTLLMPEDIMLLASGKTSDDFFGAGNTYIDQLKGQGVTFVPLNKTLEDNGKAITFGDPTGSYNAYKVEPDKTLANLKPDKTGLSKIPDSSLYWFMQLYRHWAQELGSNATIAWGVKNNDGSVTKILGSQSVLIFPNSFCYTYDFKKSDLEDENWGKGIQTNYFVSKLTDELVSKKASVDEDGTTNAYDNMFENTAAGLREDLAVLMADILGSDVYNNYTHEGGYNFPIMDADESLDTIVLDEVKGLSGYESYNPIATETFYESCKQIIERYELDRDKDEDVTCVSGRNSWYKSNGTYNHNPKTGSCSCSIPSESKWVTAHGNYTALYNQCVNIVGNYDSGNYDAVDEIAWFMWVMYGASTPIVEDFTTLTEYDLGDQKRKKKTMSDSFFEYKKTGTSGRSYSYNDISYGDTPLIFHPTEADSPSGLNNENLNNEKYKYMSDFREYLIRTNMYYNNEEGSDKEGMYTLDSQSFDAAYNAWFSAYWKDDDPSKTTFFEKNVELFYPYLYNEDNNIKYTDVSYATWKDGKQPDLDKAIIFMNTLGMDPGDGMSYLSEEQRMDLQYCTDTKITESKDMDEYQLKRVENSGQALQRYEWYIYYNKDINGGTKKDATVVYHATTTQKTCPFTPVETGLYWVDCYQSYSVKYTENVEIVETDMLLETRTQTILTSMTYKRAYPIAEKTVIEKVLLESDEKGIKITESSIKFKIREGRVATTFATERLADPIN